LPVTAVEKNDDGGGLGSVVGAVDVELLARELAVGKVGRAGIAAGGDEGVEGVEFRAAGEGGGNKGQEEQEKDARPTGKAHSADLT
jgi:hypothetical protein